MSVSPLIIRERAEFNQGWNWIIQEKDPLLGSAPEFGIFRQAKGESFTQNSASKESAWVLMSGEATVEIDGKSVSLRRGSLFDEAPSAFHVCAGTSAQVQARSECEWAVSQAENSARFEPRVFLPEGLAPEYRGRGLVQDACLRNVRLIFDRRERPGSKLVLGEVINLPGRWSSYPPHHHAQPEIYHYRFTLSQGYGHAEAGDQVFKVHEGDTLRIPGGKDHAQVSAPGYGMYYLWVVRHLENNPYTGFEFTEEHKWTLDPKQQGWQPADKAFLKGTDT